MPSFFRNWFCLDGKLHSTNCLLTFPSAKSEAVTLTPHFAEDHESRRAEEGGVGAS